MRVDEPFQAEGLDSRFSPEALPYSTSRTCFTTASVVPKRSTPVMPRTSDSTAPGERFFFLRPWRAGGGSRVEEQTQGLLRVRPKLTAVHGERK